ncbi:MAG: AraC family transcriptional regulator, partial [Sneathiella sp.]
MNIVFSIGKLEIHMNNALMRQKFANLIATLAPTDGAHPTGLGKVVAWRASKVVPRKPIVYEPGIVFMAQGVKRGFMAGSSFEYSEDTYLVLSSAVPWEVEVVEATEEVPILSLFIPINSKVIGQVAARMDQQSSVEPREQISHLPKAIIATDLDHQMRDAVVRLAEALLDPLDTEILGPLIIEEIIYRILSGPQACSMRCLTGHDTVAGKINRVLHGINSNPAKNLTVSELAEEAGMSVSAFHAAFKETATMAPIQYQKAIRLHRAQTLMSFDGLRVSEAAFEVG